MTTARRRPRIATRRAEERRPPTGLRAAMLRLCGGVMEAVVLALVCLSPWTFGAVEPVFERVLYTGVGLVLALWGVRALLQGRLTWRKCPVAVCLAGLFLAGAWQLTPLPQDVLGGLSPGTVRLYDQLLPPEPEVLPFGEVGDITAAGSTISLYPGATRQELVRLLAVLLLFAAVRNNCASAAALRRLSGAVLANGALLAFFGLFQFFSSPPNTLYWTYVTPGVVFGPFVCRNHFAFYINLCIGLGLGLLLARGARRVGRVLSTQYSVLSTQDSARTPRVLARLPGPAPFALLNDPAALGICLALALMLSAVAVCLSRGGYLALLGAAAVCLLVRLWRSPRRAWSGAALLAVAAALGLVGWFGLSPVEARATTLWRGEALRESRLPLWSDVLPLVKEFPVWGTGYGTFAHVEPLHRTSPVDTDVVYEHAHNEYLEALVEGGLVRLALTVAAVGLVLRLGCRAVRRHEGRWAGGLAAGALFAFATLVIHSIGDFGPHIPAIALLATVLCAQLCALGDDEKAVTSERSYSLRLGGLAPVLAAATAVVSGLVLYGEGWRTDQVQRCRRAALLADADDHARRIACLEAAAGLAPEYARLQAELGQAHLDAFESAAADLDTAQWVLTWTPAAQVSIATVPSWLGASAAGEELVRSREEQLARSHLLPALRHYQRARDLCPLMGKPHVRLAAYADRLGRAEAGSVYLERARRLVPFDPELWYFCGAQELLDGRPERAAESWRRCLKLSDRYLPAVVDRGAQVFGPREFLDRVLPDNPRLLLAAAARLAPGPEGADERRPFLEKALVLSQEREGPQSAEDRYVKATTHRFLGQSAEALAAYQEALARDPSQTGWRYEYAGLLCQQGRRQEARRELLVVLAQQPGHAPARDLLNALACW